jgi:hypothetical protein
MRTHRTLPTIAIVAVAAIGLAACSAINEVVTDRGVVVTDRGVICERTPEDLCNRVADLVTSTLPDELRTTIKQVTVAPRACDAEEAGDIRCWQVDHLFPGGSSSASAHQHADGTLGRHYSSNGSPPDT